MPRENKSLAVVRKRIADARMRKECVDAELAILVAIETELDAARKPKRAVKVKPGTTTEEP